MSGIIHITVDVEPVFEVDPVGIRECIVADMEKYGGIKGVRVTVDPTPAEQMELGFPRAEMDRIYADAEKQRPELHK